MPGRDKHNYPPFVRGHSCHHVAYTYNSYRSPLEKQYQNDDAMLLSVPDRRHNLGPLALHPLLDPVYGPPPKPRYTLLGDAVDYMGTLDPTEARIRKFGHVISFFLDVAEDERSNETADQAKRIADHYMMQYTIIQEGPETFINRYNYRSKR